MLIPILNFIYIILFSCCLTCPFFFLRFLFLFLPSLVLFFQLSFLFYLPLSFFFIATNASLLERWGPSFNFCGFWAGKCGVFWRHGLLKHGQGQGDHFFFCRISDLMTVENHWSWVITVFLGRSWDYNKCPCLGKSLGMCLDSSPTCFQTQKQRAPLNPSPAV